MNVYVSNKAARLELWDIHRELKTAMTELMTNRNYGNAAEVLLRVDRRMAGLLNALTLVPELSEDLAFRELGKKSETR